MPSLLTLNVSNPPRARAEALLHWLWSQDEAVWVLTEVGTGPGSGLLQSVCRAAGFDVHVTDRSELGVLTVARVGSLTPAPSTPPSILPGRVDSLVWQDDSGEDLRILATYGAASDPVRYSSKAQRERKRRWLTAYAAVVREWTAQGERGIVLGDLNLVDAFRRHHPEASISWMDHSGVGCRYDHAFVTPDVTVTGCDLVHEPRVEGLTDHSALTLTIS